MNNIKKVYKGLPGYLEQEVLWVAREYRTNDLSHIPGGADVVVEYQNGDVLGYDWIKKPSAYIEKVFKELILEEHDTDIEELDEDEQLDVVKGVISKIFARKYMNDAQYSSASFKEIWDSQNASELPRITLENYDVIKKKNTSGNTSNNRFPIKKRYNDHDEDLPF